MISKIRAIIRYLMRMGTPPGVGLYYTMKKKDYKMMNILIVKWDAVLCDDYLKEAIKMNDSFMV